MKTVTAALVALVFSFCALIPQLARPQWTGVFNPMLIECSGNDQYTKILMHYDTSTTLDQAAGRTPVTWTAVNAPTIGTTAPLPKFGPGELNLASASSQSLTTPDVADWSPGGNWSMDASIYPVSVGAAGNAIASHVTAGIVGFYWQMNASGKLLLGTTTNTVFLTGLTTITLNTRHHVAIVGNGANITQYLDGIADPVGGGTISLQAATAQFQIGNMSNVTNRPWDGRIDEFRWSNGAARWTTNFTPPTAPYC